MILGNWAIRIAIEEHHLKLEPFTDSAIQPTSIDLHLANDILIPQMNTAQFTDASRPISYTQMQVSAVFIPAHGFLLARTVERVTLDKTLTAFVEGRSSVGRMGLFIQNAGWVDPGFDGTITLELFNALPNPVRIPVGTRICQLVVAEAKGADAYKGKYQGQIGTRGSELWRDFRDV